MMAAGLTFIKKNWIMVVIIFITTLLRTWQLETQAVFFPDSGRDVLVAADAVQSRSLPLLGIPSSVPQFKQGPLAIWLGMASIAVFGENLLMMSLVFAAVGIAAVIAVYELVTIYLSRRAGWLAAGLMAISPLAVAQSRMVYHTNPIPLAVIFSVWMLLRLWHHKPWAIFWSCLAWALVFQFELTLLPLVVMIGYVIWRRKLKLRPSMALEALAGLGLGLLPQIIYDLTHGFSQLGAFSFFVIKRMGSTVVPGADHTFGVQHIVQSIANFWLYWGRIVSTDNVILKSVFVVLLTVVGWFTLRAAKKRSLSPVLEISWLAIIIMTLSYLAYGAQSEAYFPVFIPLLAIVMAGGAWLLPKLGPSIAISILLLMGMVNLVGIFQHHFFVSNPQAFTYGASTGEQMEIVRTVIPLTNNSFHFRTTGPGQIFPSNFDNLRWWVRQAGIAETADGLPVFIETKASLLKNYPEITRLEFTAVDVYIYD